VCWISSGIWRNEVYVLVGSDWGRVPDHGEHGTDQTIVQRLLAARNQKDSRRALLASGFIVLFQFTIFLLMGVALFVFAPAHAAAGRGRADGPHPAVVPDSRDADGSGGAAAGFDSGGGDVQCERVVEFAGGFERDGPGGATPGTPRDPGNFPLKLSRRMTLVWGAVLIVLGLVKMGPVLEAGLTVASLRRLEVCWGCFCWGRLMHGQIREARSQGCLPDWRRCCLFFRFHEDRGLRGTC